MKDRIGWFSNVTVGSPKGINAENIVASAAFRLSGEVFGDRSFSTWSA